MTIEKGGAWGQPGALPDDGEIVAADAEARAILEEARRAGRAYPVIGLTGGDLARTLGANGSADRLRSSEAMTFTVDVGEVLVDGRIHLFVAHLVARSPLWARAIVAMNAQWVGAWNLGPRAHPNDGLIDVYQCRLGFADRLKVRARLPAGAHLPHPAIKEERSRGVQVRLEKPLSIWLDGEVVDRGRDLSIRVAPDALTVVV